MPRKRKTRAAIAESQRAPAKVPDGQEGTDLTQEEKKEKLEVLLKDFDNELQSRLECLEDAYQRMIRDIERTLTVQLSLHIPQRIQKMKLTDFLAQGGVWDNSSKELDNFASQIEESIKTKIDLQPIQEENQSEDSDKGKRPTRKTRQQVKQLHDESGQGTAQKPSRKAVLAKNQSINLPPPTTARTRRTRAAMGKAAATPAHNAQDTGYWDTPLVTPKFSSKLPCTPAAGLRNIHRGERVTLMSESGSPVAADETTVFVPMGDKMVMIGESNLDNEAKLVLQKLREQLLKCQAT